MDVFDGIDPAQSDSSRASLFIEKEKNKLNDFGCQSWPLYFQSRRMYAAVSRTITRFFSLLFLHSRALVHAYTAHTRCSAQMVLWR